MYKNILVTGGAGYIGSHVVLGLKKANFNPFVLDNLSRGHKKVVKSILKVPMIVGDIGDQDLVKNILSGNHEKLNGKKIDAVMHFAAFAYVGESINNPMMYFKNNVENSLNLINSIVNENFQRIKKGLLKIPIIFSSSCATYGVPKILPIKENTIQLPINPYGRSKLIIENVLSDYAKAYNLPSVIYRYFNAAGCDPDGLIGENHNPETHLIPRAFQAIEGFIDTLQIFGDDYETKDGSCIRDYIHVSDLADAHILGLSFLDRELNSDKRKKVICEAFNLGNGNGYSVKEVIKTIENITNKKVPSSIVKRRIGDPPILFASSTKAKEILGWIPRYFDLRSIIQHAWIWFKKNN